LVGQRVKAYRKLNGLPADTQVPVDAVTASASGLDPDISVANARLQAKRVARVRGVSDAVVLQAIDDHTSDRTLGVLGEKTIDVLALNRALDGLGT
jgi:K+-transporting ATPase ATPase C chain